jgi:hypothetical protein
MLRAMSQMELGSSERLLGGGGRGTGGQEAFGTLWKDLILSLLFLGVDSTRNDTNDTPVSPQNSSDVCRDASSCWEVVATLAVFAKIPSATQR